jgi:hypothetical protein
MLMLLLLVFLGAVFFFVVKFATVVTTMVAIVVGVTTVAILACVWVGTSYYLKELGYEPKTAQRIHRQVDTDLKQIIGDLQEIRSQLVETEPHLRNVEFLKYARQNRNGEK